jgi:hypothetical protein
MEKSIKTVLCKGLRACGLRKEESEEIVNLIAKWVANNGPEWTNGRLKDLKQWYESYLAGAPAPPPWFKHSKEGLPLGIWGRLFRTKNQAKVLAVLSSNTVLVHRGNRPLASQVEKFHGSLTGAIRPTGRPDPDYIRDKEVFGPPLVAVSGGHTPNRVVEKFLDPRFLIPPTTADMTKRVPVDHGRKTISTDSKEARAKALRQSWACTPWPSLMLLEQMGLYDWMPVDDPFHSVSVEDSPVAGRIACLQEPGLKARWIGNPNRISQHLMFPLREVWNTFDEMDPCTCTTDQDRGVRWAQEKLRQGVTLSGADLTSASDLLELDSCLALLDDCYFRSLGEDQRWLYDLHVEHFRRISRMDWVVPERYGFHVPTVRWEKGWCLGTAPSFPLLSLVNSRLAAWACADRGLDPADSYRVIGDDIIMISELTDAYYDRLAAFGGVINQSKTLTSDRVAEFAGRVITPERVMLKTYKFKEPSDNSFMLIPRDLGPQAKALLRPRQRRVWEVFKYMPGIAIDGPWSYDSFGEPLDRRLIWAYIYTGSLLEDRDPVDPSLTTVEADLLYTRLATAGTAETPLGGPKLQREGDADYLSAEVLDSPRKSSSDPRYQGRDCTLLEYLEQVISESRFKRYDEVWSDHDQSEMVETGAQPGDCGAATNRELSPTEMAEVAQKAIDTTKVNLDGPEPPLSRRGFQHS